MIPYICFQAGEARCALELSPVVRVLRYENLIPVPAASQAVEGVLNLGGEVVPVLDLRLRLGLPRGEPTRRSRVLIVQQGGRKHGLLVDGVREILPLEETSIVKVPGGSFGLKAELVAGVAKVRDSLLVILDLARLLAEVPR